ncbi:MAG: putative porin [Phenylobacterium sp.]|jgi:predicted porin
MNNNLALILTFGCFAANAEQSSPCQSLASNDQQCDHQIGWYLGGSLGLAQTDVDNHRIEQHFEQNNLDVSRVSTDNDDIGGNIMVGYQFNRYFALEAGYLDFAERSVHFSGQTTDIAAFYAAAKNIYPQSGDGVLVALVASWPMSERFKLSAKLGYFDWQGDYVTLDDQGQQGSATTSDGDVLIGAELNYRLNAQTQLFTSYQRVKLNQDDNDMFAVGLRYYFAD